MNPVKAKILVVDDLPEKLLVYRAILDELRQEVVVANSGEEALKQVLHHEFAVILLDVNMPGIDGFETAALIRSRKRSAHTPIIFITALADEMRAAEAYALGAVDFILAPVVPEILRAKVKVFVELFRMAEAIRRHADERIALIEERTRREAAEETNRRLSFLTHAKSVIGRSLDPQETAHDILRVVVPRIASRALLALRDDQFHRWQLLDAGMAMCELVISSETTLDSMPADWRETMDRAIDHDEPMVRGQSPSGETQTLILPLRGRARVFGVLILVAPAGQNWSGPDLTMAEALASRCGIAIDNARLHQEVREADRQKNEFLSMLAHELRNPLAPIRSAVDVLRMHSDCPPDVVWARDVIDRQVVNLVRLVDDLLDVSRITRGKIRLDRERVSVDEIVSSALETSRPLLESHGHELRVELPPGEVTLTADCTRLAQVLANLLNNAAKYTPNGGTVTLAVQEEEADVVFRVRDTGTGIPPEMLGKIFDLFTQVDRSLDRSQGGLGVGLTLVRKLVELHGGTVVVASPGVGRGAEFTVRLPRQAADESLATDVDTSAATAEFVDPLRILIVDDNRDAADSLARFFRLSGQDTRAVYDGASALTVARQFSPQVVVLDLGLPGIDGFSVVRQWRSHVPQCRPVFVAVSGYGHEDILRKAQDAGFDRHFAKPVDAGSLLDEVMYLVNCSHDKPVESGPLKTAASSH